MSEKFKTQYDYMRLADSLEEDAMYPEEWNDQRTLSDKEKLSSLISLINNLILLTLL